MKALKRKFSKLQIRQNSTLILQFYLDSILYTNVFVLIESLQTLQLSDLLNFHYATYLGHTNSSFTTY